MLTSLNFETLVALGICQRMALTFDTHVAEFIYLFNDCIYQLSDHRAAIVSEKSIVFTFSHTTPPERFVDISRYIYRSLVTYPDVMHGELW